MVKRMEREAREKMRRKKAEEGGVMLRACNRVARGARDSVDDT